MAEQVNPDFTDYLKAATLNQYNLIASGGLLLFGLMSGSLAILIPIWLGLEMITVMGLSTSEKFQAHVQHDLEMKAYRKEEQLLVDSSGGYQHRYHELKDCYEEIKKAAASSKTNASITVWQPEIDKLHYVLSSYIRLAHHRSNLDNLLKDFKADVLQTRIDQIQRQQTGATDRLKFQYQRYLEILDQRIEKGQRVTETSEAIRVQLSIIEEQFKLIQQQVYLVKSPKELTDQLDFLVEGITDLETQGNLLISGQAELDAFVIPPPPDQLT